MPSEKDLDHALATELEINHRFLEWFISRTKFAGHRVAFHSVRSNYVWGSHPFPVQNPATGEITDSTRESETDVLLLVKDHAGTTLAIHIENKVGAGRFTKLQPEMYEHRAAHWIGDAGRGGYSDFDTVLLAPEMFRQRNAEQAAIFGSFVSHESVADYIPLYGEA